MLEIVTLFSARLYGNRSQRNRKLIDGVRRVVQENQC
jgi:predicted site-specific integrase-resolvase